MAVPLPDFLDRDALTALQARKLRRLLDEALPSNVFLSGKFARAGMKADSNFSLSDLRQLPFTTKAELSADQQAFPPYGRNLTYPLDCYCRLHQTSGTTTGQPLRWLDTLESWFQLVGFWESFFRMTGVTAADRLFFPFSFGPFLGFWTAFEAAARQGIFCLPAGGMSSSARLRFLMENQATVILCTPTYALRLAEVAAQDGIDLSASSVRALIVAGEPGGSIGATRSRIEAAWGARVFDHYGLTEIGPVAIECQEQPGGLHILESSYIVEVINPTDGQLVAPGQVGELVLSNLDRIGSPILRYRTGDLVRNDPGACTCRRTFTRLEGGVLGRVDDMIHLRGNNLYPSALEAVIRRFAEVVEYRVEIDAAGPLAVARIEVELSQPTPRLTERIAQAIRDDLLFRADVIDVPAGSLPRHEMKAKRIHIKK
ncbi:MAG: phenylacetate--CoA ligase family protein [Gemmataceae bacterium]